MSWTFNGTRIYVQKIADDYKQIIARLQPINNKTVPHIFGYESPIFKVTALVATDTDKAALKALYNTGLSYELVAPEGSLGNYFISSINFNREDINCIVLFDRPGLDSESPVYAVDMELFLDD